MKLPPKGGRFGLCEFNRLFQFMENWCDGPMDDYVTSHVFGL